MGRLRNLSASFKAATFSNSSTLSLSPFSKSSANGQAEPVDNNGPSSRSQDTPTPAESPRIAPRTDRAASRPASMIYTPPSMDMDRDNHVEELRPVFSFLSSHNNKLYQEGYFLKLNDLDTHGRPNNDRNWTECFAQLVGTVLSLWDAAALDAAGQDGEVAPTFINLADASIKMIETLPTRNPDVQPLQNVLSISTAGKNRYLLHFNSLHSLTQWTAGIRLSMFELASLQELYTGSLIAGKGKYLNNIRVIMERTKFRTEDWARVRFGAGTPWRRCWCVIEPPDEKEWQRNNKSLKKKSVYDKPALPKGVIKFYDTKKTKKAVPIATITDAYSAYAVYPQSKSLIEQSTLVKVEGRITIHSKPESKTEGFVFVMPELHAAVTGFEMMLRWLFPVYDIFHLYGRPQRLIADTWDPRGLMFAMPKERRYGYIDIIDVAALIHTQNSDKWSEREWRKQLKDTTSKRISMTAASRSSTNLESRRPNRAVSEAIQGVQYGDRDLTRSSTMQNQHSNQSTDAVFASPSKALTAPANAAYLAPSKSHHSRSVSESAYVSPTRSRGQRDNYNPSRLSAEYNEGVSPVDAAPVPPAHRNPFKDPVIREAETSDDRYSSDSDNQGQHTYPEDIREDVRESTPPAPVMAPPDMQHHAADVPQRRPDARPDLRREKSRMSSGTLSQIVDVNRQVAHSGANAAQATNAAMVAWQQKQQNGRAGENTYYAQATRGVNNTLRLDEIPANQPVSKEVVKDAVLTQSPADVRPETARFPSSHSITRKPVPQKHISTTTSTLLVPASIYTKPGDDMSQYSVSNYDRSAASSPDYASLANEDDNRQTLPRRTRSGTLKTVGDATMGAGLPKVDIPDVDFGITFTPALTPGHSRPATASGMYGRESPISRPLTAPSTPMTRSPEDDRRMSTMTPEYGQSAERPNSRPSHSRSPSYAWQPGVSLSRQNTVGGDLTAEEFVNQRAAAARLPHGYVAHRSASYGNVERSPNKLQKKRNSTMARPNSRNSVLMDYSPHLTAREQEHVARMTGGPLIQVEARSKTPDPSVGLIGAIEAREQEKRNIREGLAGSMVQSAIAQRQAAERNYGPQQSGYGVAGDQWSAPQNAQTWQETSSQHPHTWNHQAQWQHQQQHPNYPPQQGHQLPPQQQYQRQPMYDARYDGYYGTQNGYDYR